MIFRISKKFRIERLVTFGDKGSHGEHNEKEFDILNILKLIGLKGPEL